MHTDSEGCRHLYHDAARRCSPRVLARYMPSAKRARRVPAALPQKLGGRNLGRLRVPRAALAAEVGPLPRRAGRRLLSSAASVCASVAALSHSRAFVHVAAYACNRAFSAAAPEGIGPLGRRPLIEPVQFTRMARSAPTRTFGWQSPTPTSGRQGLSAAAEADSKAPETLSSAEAASAVAEAVSAVAGAA